MPMGDAPDSIPGLLDRAQAAYGRFTAGYDLRDLDEAVDAWDVLLGNPSLGGLPPLICFQLLSNGGHIHLQRYLATRMPPDLEAALRYWQGAFDPLERAIADGDADSAHRPVLLASVAGALEERYARGRSVDDLTAALSTWHFAVEASAPDSPYLGGYRASLARLLFERYERQPQRETLDEAIAAAELAGQSDQLAVALGERYVRFGVAEDLERAIGLYEEATARLPDDEAGRARILNNFGRLLHQRFVRSGSLEDSQRSIDVINEALSLVPASDPFRTTILRNLDVALDARHVVTGELREESVDRAVDSTRQALEQTAHDSPEWSWRLFELATLLLARYLDTADPEDLDEASAALDAAMSQWVLDSPHLPRFMSSYAMARHLRFEATGAPEDLEAAIKAYAMAMIKATETSPGQAVAIGQQWGTHARRRQAWGEAAWAYGDGLTAMTRLFETQLQRHSKERWLVFARGIAAEAAYARAKQQEYGAAVEALEIGRALLLSEAVELDRARLDGLVEVGRADLKARYESAAERWNQLSA
ncbi:hypothetical protein OHA21_21340 [Actinoplanes sp. NBC_00393]|uniref:hypothetical protein n=1 Tax=Actinoplanes sp. NBC_00393 TaxID=2975953 RepID=UPI002E1A2C53